MISYLGNISLWLSFFFALLQLANSNKNNKYFKTIINEISAIGLLFFSFITFFTLMYAHIYSDFTLINVYQNSHTTKPLLYKISGVWGNHEGSMLLWNLVLSSFNFFLLKLYNKKNINFVNNALEMQALITSGFILFTLLTSNPFNTMETFETNGLGFNPILQDPA